jgi:hypothetical protein
MAVALTQKQQGNGSKGLVSPHLIRLSHHFSLLLFQILTEHGPSPRTKTSTRCVTNSLPLRETDSQCTTAIELKLSLCLTNYALRHEGVWGSGCIDPRILYIGTSWRLVLNFTPRPLYPRGKSPRYPLDRRLGGPQSLPGCCEEKKNLALPGIEPGLYRLCCSVSCLFCEY